MCCCGKPTINGELGYRWQPNDAPSVRTVNAPVLGDTDALLFDEPGRCGGLDCHSHHFRVVKRFSTTCLLVRHGGGDERIDLLCLKRLPALLEAMDSDTRYWMLYTIYDAHRGGAQNAREDEALRWRQAAAGKRIKVRKQRGSNRVTVSIEPKSTAIYLGKV